jgi:hypothetical protein
VARRPTAAAVAGAICGLALALSACAQIPTSGPVERGAPVLSAEDDPQVRVLPRGPVPGQTPQQVVAAFLDASASFEDDHRVARQFLTPRARDVWKADAGVTVLDDLPRPTFELKGDRVVVRARQTARITADGAFLPSGGTPIQESFRMKQDGDLWQIAALPQGLMLDRLEVSLAYRAFDIYFMNPSHTFLVADPVHLPVTQAGSATSLVQAMLTGPTRWLRPAVDSAIPAGTSLNLGSVPVENGVAQVDLSAEFYDATPEGLEEASAQITATLLELSPSVTDVSISVEGQPLQLPSAPPIFTSETWERYDSDTLTPALGALYVDDGVVYRIDGDNRPTVQGAFGTGDFDVRDPSMSWNGGIVTALNQSRTELLLNNPFLSLRVDDTVEGRRFLPATIDGDDRAWLLDVGGREPRLRVRTGDRWRSAVLRAPAGEIRSFRVSPDGARVAVVISRGSGSRDSRDAPGSRDSGARSELMVGRVVQGADGYRVEAFRTVDRDLADVRDASWVDARTLVVIASNAGSVVKPMLVNIDRTVTELTSDLVGATTVSGAPGLPLLAATRRGVIVTSNASDWRALVDGSDPTYPG